MHIVNALSNKASVPSGVPQRSTTGSNLFLVMVDDLPVELQSFLQYDITMEVKTTEIEIIQPDLLKTSEWAARNCMVLKPSESAPTLWDTLIPDAAAAVPKSGRCSCSTFQVTKDLSVIVRNTFNPWEQLDATVTRLRSKLAYIQLRFERLASEIFLPIYSAVTWSPSSA